MPPSLIWREPPKTWVYRKVISTRAKTLELQVEITAAPARLQGCWLARFEAADHMSSGAGDHSVVVFTARQK
jgi:hypothetical protein